MGGVTGATVRVAVTGGRDYEITPHEAREFRSALASQLIASGARHLVLVHGGARGVDSRAAEIAEAAGYATAPYEAAGDWMKRLGHGKVAGPMRSWQMLQGAHVLIAFPGGEGTAGCVQIALPAGISVIRIGAPG